MLQNAVRPTSKRASAGQSAQGSGISCCISPVLGLALASCFFCSARCFSRSRLLMRRRGAVVVTNGSDVNNECPIEPLDQCFAKSLSKEKQQPVPLCSGGP